MATPISEIAARAAEATLLAVVDAFPDAVILVDQTGSVRGLNQAGEKFFGYSAGAVIGGPASTFIDLTSLGMEQGSGELVEAVGTRKDGTCFLLRAAVSTLPLDGEQLRLLSVRRADQKAASETEVSTGRKELEKQIIELSRSRETVARQREEMRELVEDLTEARDKAELENREKSDFLAIQSHKLRRPLDDILEMATSLSASALSAEQERQVEKVKRAGDALLVIVNDLLDLAQIEGGKTPLENLAGRYAMRDTIIERPSSSHPKDLLQDLDDQLNDVLSHLYPA